MGYGRMVLASDIPENVDVLARRGILFRSRDVSDLADKLVRVLQLHGDDVNREGRNLHEFGMDTYNWDHITDTVEAALMGLFR
jgi:glycosyltransferase involved in cell wall biosynthesis